MTTTTTTDIRALIRAELDELVAIRRDLHAHPELAFEEIRTSGVVQRELEALGAGVRTHYAKGTGVVGFLPGDAERSVALRADMDALPIVEQTGIEHASTLDGVMHACGHDGHTTILLGAARVLSKIENRPNPVTFVFQPAEEGGGGGELMAQEGALAGEDGGGIGAPARAIYGLHGWPELDLGKVGTRAGPLLASTDDFVVTIRGVQAHAAWPHAGRDPIVCAAQVINALQTVVSRSSNPADAVVLTVGAIHGGTADNIIPESVSFIGTIRTLDDTNRAMAERRFKEIVDGVTRSMGCRAEIDWKPGYPVTRNEAGATETFFKIADRAFGAERVERVPEAFMGGEDFSYYGEHVPACFFILGLKPPGVREMPQLHQPDFDFNDDAIAVGVEAMVRVALEG
ncbi:MAG: amidohydrolase [Planctomycetota bacterium]